MFVIGVGCLVFSVGNKSHTYCTDIPEQIKSFFTTEHHKNIMLVIVKHIVSWCSQFVLKKMKNPDVTPWLIFNLTKCHRILVLADCSFRVEYYFYKKIDMIRSNSVNFDLYKKQVTAWKFLTDQNTLAFLCSILDHIFNNCTLLYLILYFRFIHVLYLLLIKSNMTGPHEAKWCQCTAQRCIVKS